jgi:hypothetical protein
MQGQHKYGGRENMNRLKLVGYVTLAIGVGIWLYLLVLSIIDTRSQYSIVNIQYAIIAIVLVLASYFIFHYSKKSKTKQTLS